MKNLRLQRNLLLLLITASLFSRILYGLETDRQIAFLNSKVEGQARELLEKQEEIELLQAVIRNKEKDASNLKHLGTFTATFYCTCELCCGKTPEHPAYGITKSGTKVEEGRTIAVDPKVIPLGSEVIVDGNKYIAEDTGRLIKGNRIDIYISEHSRALELGRVNKEVYLVN